MEGMTPSSMIYLLKHARRTNALNRELAREAVVEA